jgi:RNA polymerase sigma factor (sigma-70 family)
MGDEPQSSAQRRATRSRQQSERLQQEQTKLAKLVDAKNKKEFFKQLLSLLKPLRSYIKRRLRLAYLNGQIRTPIYTSGDLLDEVVLQAYEHYDKKPENLSLEEWLYQLANERLEKYLAKRKTAEKKRKSLETLSHAELRSLEEMPITADAEGEVWFPEELDDSEYDRRDFYPPSYVSDPEEQLEREEELQRIVQALARVPEQDRIVFELFAIEGFSKDAVARISGVSPEEVPRIVERVRAQVVREIQSPRVETIDNHNRRAS